MRQTLSLAFIIMGVVACSSKPATESQAEGYSPSPSVNADSEASKSQVLAPKGCPKHSKLVNGKCMLQVESDD